jgi:prolycopene isomerase
MSWSLERHNLPGGIATSFVRGGVEMEATLHEMMSIGPADDPLPMRRYLDEMKVAIQWLRVPEAYELVSPQDGIDITLHAGRRSDGTWGAADEIEAQYPGSRDDVNALLELCHKVYESVNYLNDHTLSKLQMLRDHEELVKTAGVFGKRSDERPCSRSSPRR